MTSPPPVADSASAFLRHGMAGHPFWQMLAGLAAGAVAWVFITSESFPRVQPTILPPAAGQAQVDTGNAGRRNPAQAASAGTSPRAANALPGMARTTGLLAAFFPAIATQSSEDGLPGEDSESGVDQATEIAAESETADGPQSVGEETPHVDATGESAGEAANSAASQSTASAAEPTEANTGEQPLAEPLDEVSPLDAVEDPQAMMRAFSRMRGMRGMGGPTAGGGLGGIRMTAPTPEENAAIRVANIKNAALKIGFFGIVLCGLFGLVEGVSRRSLIAPLVGMLVGLLVGAGGGALAGAAGMAIYHVEFDDLIADYLDRHPQVDELQPILEGMLIYGAMWAILGAAGGLSMSLLSRRSRSIVRSVTGAVIGGVLGGVLYATLEAWAFPLLAEGLVVPRDAQNGLLWALLPAGLTGLLGSWQGRVLPKSVASPKMRADARPA